MIKEESELKQTAKAMAMGAGAALLVCTGMAAIVFGVVEKFYPYWLGIILLLVWVFLTLCAPSLYSAWKFDQRMKKLERR